MKDSSNTFIATMDSPDQNVRGVKVDDFEISGDSIYMFLPEVSGEYNGVYQKDKGQFEGSIRQNGVRFVLRLLKGDADDLLYKRPQKPLKPFPYKEEEVTIVNNTDVDTLSGTFTKPYGAGKFPVAILITGSGPEDRDETVFAHKPFLLLSDYLTRKGFAVLRCDDRGTAKSTGVFKTATSADFARDVEAQIDYLKKRSDIDVKRIGLIGHSEGGVIAPMVAAKRNDVAFIVMMAGPSIDMFDLLLIQDSLVAASDGLNAEQIKALVNKNKKLFEFIRTVNDSTARADSIDSYLSGLKISDQEILLTIRQLCSPWMRWYVGYDPGKNLRKLHCAVLAINGEKDVQVPAQIDIGTIERILKGSGNKNYETQILPGLNHLFQHCVKCSVGEYIDIEETMDPAALSVIGYWMEKNFLAIEK